MSKNLHRNPFRLPLVATLAACGLVAACGSEDPHSTATTKQAETTPPTHESTVKHLPPPLHVIAGELRRLDGITDAQRSELKKLVADIGAKSQTFRPLRRNLLTLAASQVRQGAIDRAAITAYAQQVHNLMKGSGRQLAVTSLNRLHAILTPAQRQELVDHLRDRIQARRAHHPKLAGFFKPLGLSPAQRKALSTAMAAHLAGKDGLAQRLDRRAKLRAAADAFVSEHFDASQIHILTPPDKPMKARLGHALVFAEKVLPILTQTQRDVLAALIDARALKLDAKPTLTPAFQ
ncbi:MAG: Spy/CpxP family protein refolding chaperone [Deltaproteobacteria bacterium]|nr:Spy/CpxP family protein refolding chaperone [Deltaproteobacteria bacterium]